MVRNQINKEDGDPIIGRVKQCSEGPRLKNIFGTYFANFEKGTNKAIIQL